MSSSTPPSDASVEIERGLRAGVRPEDCAALAAALGLPPGEDELELGRTLVTRAVALQAERVRLAGSRSGPGAERDDDSRVLDGRSSFLMRLTRGGDQASVDLERIDDLRTLLAVVRAGSLRQRRAAVLRIGELVEAKKSSAPELVRTTIAALGALRAMPIAYELWLVGSRLPGAEGRRARAEGDAWTELSERFGRAVLAFWDGVEQAEPVSVLRDEQRVQLLSRTRDLSDAAVFHLCAILEGNAGDVDRRARSVLLSALLNAGDARLLPVLRSLVESGDPELLIPAARALGRIDDPRAHSVLKSAYERTATPEPRLVLAGALGANGDSRGLGCVRDAFDGGDDRLLPYALEALCELGGRDDAQAVLELLERHDPALQVAATQTLGRIGDGRALIALQQLVQATKSSALRAEIEEALLAIHARMELLGEEAQGAQQAVHSFDTAKRAVLVRRKDPPLLRLRAHVYHALGGLWLAIGARSRGVARLEAAAALLPDWPLPVLRLAMSAARRKDFAQALANFRRVLGIDRGAVEDNATAARVLAQAFLRRAEAMEREGRADIARGLLEEALSFDLRKAPSDLRFALEQRLERLRVRAA